MGVLASQSRRAGEGEVKEKDSLDESSDLASLPEGSVKTESDSPAVVDDSEDAEIDSPLDPKEGMDLTADPEIFACRSLGEWLKLAEEILKSGRTFTDLGDSLLKLISKAPTPLGRFFRQWCLPAQPHPGAVPPHRRRGDILPMPIWMIGPHLQGISNEVAPWLQAIFTVLNYNYCTGWTRPICVPMEGGLTENQMEALLAAAKTVTTNVLSSDALGSWGDARKLLASKRFDYAGAPIEYMEDLEADKIAPCWPRASEAGIQEISRYLGTESKAALQDPRKLLLPPDKMPENAPRSRVRASDQEWFKICRMAHQRGLMKVVDDSLIPRDGKGHLITSGAGGVVKEKVIDGVVKRCQRFISILCPVNACTVQLKGAQDTLPFIGTLTALQLQEEQVLYLESEDLQSAFNLFSMPSEWLPFFAYSKKVDGSAFGLRAGTEVRPALCVVPMGWHSAVGLVQEAVRCLVFEKAGVPLATSVEKGKLLPDTDTKSVVYLDNFDEIHIIQRCSKELGEEDQEMSEFHRKFVEVCDGEGLPRNLGKQLIHAFAGGLQGGLLDGENGVLRVAPEKLQNFIKISLALLGARQWNEFHLRHWAGKAAFIGAFRRLLFANMFEIFPLIEQSRRGDVAPTREGLDEILSVMLLSTMAQANLRAELSNEISATDASPTGGATAIATRFKSRNIRIPDAVARSDTCCVCGESLPEREWSYPCSRKCGAEACCSQCAFTHFEGQCSRDAIAAPTFAERFAGPNFPLTQAVALEGIAIQPPLDIKIESYPWDFFTEMGKKKLDSMEKDPNLEATHWAPECKTFSAARGKPIVLASGKRIKGPRALRSEELPWGLKQLSKEENIKVRQGNSMAKRSIQGMLDGLANSRIVSFEHPFNSLFWHTPEGKQLLADPRIHVAVFSNCCHGGWRRKWTRWITNEKEIADALHLPDCPGHDWLQPYQVHETPDGLQFDTEEEGEYPWELCAKYAKALKRAFDRRAPEPAGLVPRDRLTAIYSAIKRATKGLQNPAVAKEVAKVVDQMVDRMQPGDEKKHLAGLLRQVSTRGCDIKMMVTPESGEFTLMAPYPAFVWLWRTLVSYRWMNPQQINTLEVSAFLVEQIHQYHRFPGDFSLSHQRPILIPTAQSHYPPHQCRLLRS